MQTQRDTRPRKTTQLEECLLGASTRTMDVDVDVAQPPRRRAAFLARPFRRGNQAAFLARRIRRRRMRRRCENQAALKAWLDEQERLIRMRGIPDEDVREFDPLHNLPEPQGDEVEQGRRTIEFRFAENLEGSIADRIQAKIVEHVHSRFMLKLSAQVELQHLEDPNRKMDYYHRDNGTSPWFETLTAVENWVRRQEELRLENRQTPDTKWTYVRTKRVYVKVILDRHPLFLGLGRLPDWLRNKRGVLSLDTYRDNRCLFRCIAVHQGAKVRDNMRKTRELENAFFAQHPGLRNRLTDKHLPLLERHFKQGIAAYTVQPNGDFILTHFPANYHKVGKPVLTMGLYAGHAFLIKNLGQVARSFTCAACHARITTASNLMRHAKDRCSGGRAKINCPNNRIEVPSSAYEKAFYPEARCSFIATKWLEWEAKQRGIHIHHARCGHGGERHILGARVDGYHPETKTVFQYHGCFWHGCKQCYLRHRPVQQVLLHGGQGHRPGEGLFQGGQQAPERDASRAFRAGPRGQPRHSNQPGLSHAQRRDVHVRAAQARFERVLRQALGVGGRYSHGADRVPQVASQLKAAHPMAYPKHHGPWTKRRYNHLHKKAHTKPQALQSLPCLGNQCKEPTGGNTVPSGTTISSSRTNPRFGPSSR